MSEDLLTDNIKVMFTLGNLAYRAATMLPDNPLIQGFFAIPEFNEWFVRFLKSAACPLPQGELSQDFMDQLGLTFEELAEARGVPVDLIMARSDGLYDDEWDDEDWEDEEAG